MGTNLLEAVEVNVSNLDDVFEVTVADIALLEGGTPDF